MKDVVAIYPGSFDPLTNGHVDIIHRGARLFDRIVIAVLINLEKAPLFTVPERVQIAREAFKDWANVEVDTFDGLLVDYARKKKANVIVRARRALHVCQRSPGQRGRGARRFGARPRARHRRRAPAREEAGAGNVEGLG